MRIFIIILLLFPFTVYSQVKFERFNSYNGISQNTIRSVTQDQKGFLWIATSDGLNRYDGLNFKIYRPNLEKPEYSLPSSVVHKVLIDSENNLWVGTRNGLRIYDSAKDRFLKYAGDSLADNKAIDVILEDSDKIIWILPYYEQKILKLDRKNSQKFEVLDCKDFFENGITLAYNAFIGIYQDQANKNILWLCTSQYVLFKYDKTNKKLVKKYKIGTSKDNQPGKMSLTEDAEGKLWIATDQGLKILDKKTEIFTDIRVSAENTESSKVCLAVFKDRNNYMWVGKLEGLCRFENKDSFTLYQTKGNDPNSLNANEVRSIYEDKAGILWIGTDQAGLAKYDPKKIKFKHYEHFETENSLSYNSIRCFTEDFYGRLWIGTTEGGLDCFDPKTQEFVHYSTDSKPALPENRITGIAHDSDGNLWVAFNNKGLLKIAFDKLRNPIFTAFEKEVPQLSLRSVCVDQKGIVWLGGQSIGLIRFDPKTKKSNTYPLDKQTGGVVLNIQKRKDGRLWLGTNIGLSLFDPETKEFINFKQGKGKGKILSENIWGVVVDSKDRTWVGTWGGGLNLFDEKTQTFEYFTEKDGLPNNVVYGILEDSKGFLWVSTNYGISKFDLEKKTFKNFTIEDGLQDNEFNRMAFYKSEKTGKMYFGGVNGFNEFDPLQIKTSTYAPPVVFTDFKLFNRSILPNDSTKILTECIWENPNLELSHEQKVLTIDFAVLHYASPNKNKYAYKMQGFDADWIETTSQKASATYTNLPSGEYRFAVRGSNSDGFWNEKETTIVIKINPPFYETWWFRLLLAILFIGSFVFWYNWRTHNLALQNEKLEQEVKLRTHKIEVQNHEILQQNEELNQNHEEISSQKELLEQKNNLLEEYNSKIKQSIKAAQTIQSAILPSEQQMKILFEDHFIINRPKDVVSGDFYWTKSINKQTFLVLADCTGHGVSGAFMTMIGTTLLDRVISVLKVREPQEILAVLNVELKETLRQKETNSLEGMDIAVLRISDEEIVFSGAKRPLYFSQNGLFDKIQAVRKSMGGRQNDKISFEQSVIVRKKNTTLYLCSDGYADQNNWQRTSFTEKRFTELLGLIQTRTLEEQKAILEEKLEEHMQNTEQRDDILVVGVRV